MKTPPQMLRDLERASRAGGPLHRTGVHVSIASIEGPNGRQLATRVSVWERRRRVDGTPGALRGRHHPFVSTWTESAVTDAWLWLTATYPDELADAERAYGYA